ncbi:hypothetical protein AX16_005893, partial [Volvariella volvacea WC 439]
SILNFTTEIFDALYAKIATRACLHGDERRRSHDFEVAQREDILTDIRSWLKDANSESRIFCLTGPVGVGKTAIGTHLVHSTNRGEEFIGGEFFFDRNDPQANNIKRFALTIALRIWETFDEGTRYISSKILRGRLPYGRDILCAPLEEQWEELVVQALNAITR